jgi:hypothetical protein
MTTAWNAKSVTVTSGAPSAAGPAIEARGPHSLAAIEKLCSDCTRPMREWFGQQISVLENIDTRMRFSLMINSLTPVDWLFHELHKK